MNILSLLSKNLLARTFLIVGIVGIVAVVGSVRALSVSEDPPWYSSIRAQESHWRDRIKTVGEEKAHAEFSQFLAKSKDPGIAHGSEHAFGGALYEAKGIKALGQCDTSEWFGCVHEFIGRALFDHGLASLSTLESACTAKYFDRVCIHSLGHGILPLIGYSMSDLKQAVDLCNTLKNDTMHSCAQGAFMEYFLPYHEIFSQGHSTGMVNNTIYSADVCASYALLDQRHCYQAEPLSWLIAEKNTQPDTSKKDPEVFLKMMGDRCASLKNKALEVRDECFFGIGYAMAIRFSVSDMKMAQYGCVSASPTNRDLATCISSLAGNYLISKHSYSSAQICAVPGVPIEACERYAASYIRAFNI